MSEEHACLLLSSGSGPVECRAGLAKLAEAILKDADESGVNADVSVRGDPKRPRSVLLSLSGDGADAMAERWVGGVQWRNPTRGRGGRKNWFMEVFRLPDVVKQVSLVESEIRFTSFRAGGPGGQHQNTTDSAVRASWKDSDGKEYVVTVRTERSQHANKKEAVIRLRALISQDREHDERSKRSDAHSLNHRVRRGAGSRLFVGPEF